MRRARRRLASLALAPLALGLLLALGRPAAAQEGELDTTFNGSGILHFGLPNHAAAVKVLAAPGGGLVVLAQGRFANGTSGNDFWKWVGDNGFVSNCHVAVGAVDQFFVADGRFDHNGKLVLVGSDADDDTLVVVRYNYPDCELDDAFGDAGVKRISSSFWGEERAVGIVERAQGFPFPLYSYFVLAAHGGTILTPRGALLVKLQYDGDVETTWGGGDGWVNHDFAPELVTPVAFEIDRYGWLVAALAVDDGSPAMHDFGVARFRGSDGAADTTFSGDGFRRIPIDADGAASDDQVFGLAIGWDRRVALVGRAPHSSGSIRAAIVVLTEDGSLDASFAGDGKRLLVGQREAHAARFLSDGRLLLAGMGIDVLARQRSFVLRLLPSGLDDPDFGTGGYAALPPIDYGGEDDVASAVILVGSKTVAAGWGDRDDGESDAWVARFTGLEPPPPVEIFRDNFETGDREFWSGP